MIIRTGIGQDSHRFEEQFIKPCVIGGIHFENHRGFKGNSDADIVLHAITNAISGVTGVNILGAVSDEMCRSGITDSSEYLKEALKHLKQQTINHVSVSIECKTPKISPKIDEMKKNLAKLLKLETKQIGITATSGEALTDFGKGLGAQAIAIVTTSEG
ncbi:MAG: 2-C-methyl-D-erythritol 2,4-cyclodiphosphate synthase [Calditrichaeota bacterium]|nr:2-C-methyl-D-erythritol 2,4-cyclodiphosphate synthase [Calditrichota bacterium]